MASSHNVSRRDFVTVVTTAVGTMIAAIVGLPAIGYLIGPAAKVQASDTWIPLGPLENYPEGTPTLFSFTRTKANGWEKTVNSYGVYVLRSPGGETRALSNRCTHLSCRVTWKEESKDYVCPCHDGHFDSNGNVTAGPPPRPLEAYETKVEDGNLFIHFVEG